MKEYQEQRCIRIARYVIRTGATVRVAAKKIGESKSTVYKDLTQNLQHIDQPLFLKAAKALQKNKAERHIRGGIATRQKYLFK